MQVVTLLVLLAALVLAGCGSQAEPSPAASASAVPAPSPTATASVAPLPSPAARPSLGGASLIGPAWEWQASNYTDGSELVVSSPSSYTLKFLDGGSLEVRADCNGVGGSYTASGDSLDITLGPSTEVACASGTQADVFVRDLDATVSYSLQGDGLVLAMDADAGSMRFGLPSTGGGRVEELRGESTLPAEQSAQLDALLARSVTLKLPDPMTGTRLFTPSPGAIMLVDTPDGRYLKAAGLARREDRTPMPIDARFQVGSNTKLFVGVLLLQLEEDGVLSLDDPLGRWLPDEAARIPNGDSITLRMLANHTAGVNDYAAVAQAISGSSVSEADLEKQYTPAELVEQAIAMGDPPFAPGAEGRWSYSNTGYILLGMVLEKAAGRPLGELLGERIFAPLGMSNTLFPDGIPEPGSIVDGYLEFGGMNTTRWNTSQAWAAGAIESTMADLLAFARALAGGTMFKNPATLQKMTAFVRAQEMVAAGYQGYGVGIAELADGIWGHHGRTPGFDTVVMIWPERGTTLIGMANASEGSVASWQLLLERSLGR